MPIFARNYDWREYDRVESSIGALLARAEEAWPQLLQHLDDKHYSFTDRQCDCAYNESVGDICETIVVETLSEAYYRCSPDPPGDEQWYHRLHWPEDLGGTPAELRAWCDKRKGKPLFALQIELCEAAIKVIPTLNEIPERDQAKCIAAVRRQIETLKKLKKPVLVERWGSRGPNGGCYTRDDAEQCRQWYDKQSELKSKQHAPKRGREAKGGG